MAAGSNPICGHFELPASSDRLTPGVTDVHALYGASQHKPEYELLRKVTHWTPEMVERERNALKPGGGPMDVLDKNFAQILPLFEVS